MRRKAPEVESKARRRRIRQPVVVHPGMDQTDPAEQRNLNTDTPWSEWEDSEIRGASLTVARSRKPLIFSVAHPRKSGSAFAKLRRPTRLATRHCCYRRIARDRMSIETYRDARAALA